MKCTSEKHEWLDPVSAKRCCNGWHQELRGLGETNPEDDPEGRVYVSGLPLIYVWVRDQAAAVLGDR